MSPSLTQAQRDAIAHRDGHLQLIACAGSGKTEVVARRVAQLLGPGADGSPPLEPRNLVAFTFTDKAGAELKARIVARVAEAHGELPGLAEMFVGTIHAFCLDLLQRESPEFLKYAVLDEVRQKLLVERHPRRSGMALTHRHPGGEALVPWDDNRAYLSALDVLRQADLVPARLAGASAVDGLAAWRELLESQRYLDYTAIMEHAVRALRERDDLRARLRARVRHVIVDEYQDVNPIQERVVAALADLGAWLCVVGDDDQTIYQWNGATLANIVGFADRYPGVRALRLEDNFRSSRAIVELARDFIAANRERLPKAMRSTEAQPSEAGDVAACVFDTAEAEAAFLADAFRDLHGVAFTERGAARGLSWSDMTVLLRSGLKRHAAPIVAALKSRGIPFLVTGMNNLFETAEARAARALFYFVAARGDATRDQLRALWIAADLGLAEDDLDRALDRAEATRDEIPYDARRRANEFAPQTVFQEFIDRLRLREETVPGERGRAEAVFANLGAFSGVLGDFEAVHHHSGPAEQYAALAVFLERAAADQYGEGLLDNPVARPDAVRIMTIHKAKGLQWPVVAIPGLADNRFPSTFHGRNNWWNLLPVDAVVNGARYHGDTDDERRLFYVAATRAQKWLLASWAPSATARNQRRASPFFAWLRARPGVSARPPRHDHRPRAPASPRAGVEDLRLDFTSIKSLFECPYRFKLRTVYGFGAPPEPAQGFGKALHDALAEINQRALDGRPPTADAVPDLIETHLHLPYATPTVYRELREVATRVLTTYLTEHADTLAQVTMTEKVIELPLGDGVTVSGRIDLVVRGADGRVSIVDYKSTARAQSEEQTDAQLHLYALGYRALTGRDADAVEVWELDDDRRHGHAIDDVALADVRSVVARAAAMLRAGELPPWPERERCGRCGHRGICAAGERAVAGEE
jgi:DNA helicase-2/ATP-dependent DNA helicase PcrA